ncbi:MAG: ATP-binding cassette domain-containing protein, partial [Clostridia bacterium]|nr:ATP-binding cassette domain-containing protein [Clostridia bacterium]
MTLINCEKLAFSYDQKPVIKDLSFSISKGDYLCIVGENGVGKSTLIKCILGLIKPSGSITFGEGLSQSKIGYLPQQSEIQKDFPASVYEVVISGTLNKSKLIPFYTKRQKELAKKNLNLLGLDNIKKKCYQDLSGGQQQRVLLARALCAADSLILLDEPSSGLDP